MIKNKILYSVEETTEFLNSLEKKGYNTTMTVIGVTECNNHYTVFYKYLESLEKNEKINSMKELSIEEKAKRYDQAIKVAKSKIKNDKDHVLYEDDIIEIFPELKESEDERIRKEILEYFRQFKNEELRGVNISDWIAWLEKQGYKDEEILVLKDQIESLHAAIKALKEAHKIELEKQGEQKPTDKVEPKFKVGDKVVIDGQVCSIKIVNEDNYIVNKDGRDVQIHFSYTKDWKLVEQKNSSWSEDDEKKLNYLIALLQNSTMTNAALSATNEGIEDFLKSLKDRYTWKPSEEQMEALANALSLAKNCGEESAFDLRTLYEQLSKLRE